MTHFNEADDFGVMVDYLRIHAAAVLARQYPELMFITSGGKGQLSGVANLPFISEVMMEEMMALGVSRDRIFLESNSGNTYSQLFRIQEMVVGWGLGEDLVLVSNLWQLERMKAMIDYAPQLGTLRRAMVIHRLDLVSAEKILIADDPATWSRLIQEAYATEKVRERVGLEMKGVIDIMAGTYEFVLRS
jgi:hypothetical protein